MKIAIDGYEANVAERLGSSQVAFELLKNFERLDSQNEFTIYLPNAPLADLPKERPGWKYKILKINKFWTRIVLPAALYLSKEKFDIIFSPTHYIPKFSPFKRIGMIFDLSFLHFPKMFKKSDLYKLTNWSKETILKTDHIITISEFSKKNILKNYPVPESKITVAYPGYNKEIFFPTRDQRKIEEIKEKYKISGDYIIFNGTIQPRKNIIRLIQAYKEILKEYPDLKLVLTGKIKGLGRSGWMNQDILETSQKLGIEEKVIFTGFVEDQDLPVLISGAKVFCLPSLWEGFGIPALEAMACGTPVVVSNVSSLPEVVAHAGVLVDPYLVSEIAEGIKLLLKDKSMRQKKIRLGLARAKHFSWEKMASQILEVFIKVSKN